METAQPTGQAPPIPIIKRNGAAAEHELPPHCHSGETLSILLGVLLALGLFRTPVVRADEEEPDLMQTLIAEDVTLNNNIDPSEPMWQKGPDGRQTTFGFGFEKTIEEHVAIDVGSEFKSVSPRDSAGDEGFGNVDLLLKYVFLSLPPFKFASGLTVSLPTNSHIGGETMDTNAGIFLAWGGRLSGLPKRGWRGYLRALEIQGDIAYSHTFAGSGTDDVSFDPVLDYSLPYLSYSGFTGISGPLSNTCIFTEMSFDLLLSGAEQNSLAIFITPGIAYMTPAYQISVAMQLPLDRQARQGENVAVIAGVVIAIDRIEPAFAWTLF
jgi:hypothetical protein